MSRGPGLGTMIGGSLLGTVAGVVIGSANADMMMPGIGDFGSDFADGGAADMGGGDYASGADALGGDAGGGFGDFGGDAGGFGDFGGDF